MGILNTDNEDEIKDILEKQTKEDADTLSDNNIKEDKLTVVLNGPLSEVMTKALNLVLSNESTMTTMVSLFKIESDKRKEETITDKDVYVYSTNSDNLDKHGLMETINEIDENSEGYPNIIITLESSKITQNNIHFYNFCKSKGYSIFTNEGLAVDKILNIRFKS